MIVQRLPVLALLGLALLGAGCDPTPGPKPTQEAGRPISTEPVLLAPEIASFYAERGNRPVWVANGALRPGAEALIRRIAGAANDGLDPERYDSTELVAALHPARGGDRRALARTELLLSRAFTAFIRDLRVPANNRMKYIDAGLAPRAPEPRELLEAAASAQSLSEHVAAITAMNPLYESLRRGYSGWRAVPGPKNKAQERLIRSNLDRARAIAGGAGRYIIVDTASARLWMIENGRVAGDPMRVIVGKNDMQTPVMAGLMRYVTLNPYWNVPPDLARERARKVLRGGPRLIAREHLQILSDWGDSPRLLKASQVDWAAIASGKRTLRLRQLPGGANVMGKIKFMMPNDLGIYLHDFPDKSLFERSDRRISSGCVRLIDAPRLAHWLYRGKPPRPAGAAPEQNVDLPEAVPVYIAYLTVLPDGQGGLAFRPDSYGRDRRAS
jgi:murein L,D-transpeptidase YcbB/YkuD